MQQHQHLLLTRSTAQRTGQQHPRFSVFVLRPLFLTTVSCRVPVLLAVVTVAIKFLGALTFALTSYIVLATLAIDLLAISFLSISLLAILALTDCTHIHWLWSSMSIRCEMLVGPQISEDDLTETRGRLLHPKLQLATQLAANFVHAE